MLALLFSLSSEADCFSDHNFGALEGFSDVFRGDGVGSEVR